MGVSSQCHAPAALPPGMTQYLLDRRLGGSQGQPGQAGIISFPPGFDPQTVQPVASHYTNYTSVSQLPGRGPVPGTGINYTGPREVLLEFVILVF